MLKYLCVIKAKLSCDFGQASFFFKSTFPKQYDQSDLMLWVSRLCERSLKETKKHFLEELLKDINFSQL